jgi:hypothetical protein
MGKDPEAKKFIVGLLTQCENVFNLQFDYELTYYRIRSK